MGPVPCDLCNRAKAHQTMLKVAVCFAAVDIARVGPVYCNWWLRADSALSYEVISNSGPGPGIYFISRTAALAALQVS